MKTTLWQQVTWLLMPIIALGGLYYHKLGLLLLPIMLTLIVLGVFRGKYWCGKLCPHGSLFDV
ncbi:MAG: 4Fe-4S binding protein, partial [Limnochordia bacterium]|nr:4Fe-4S binding protein [Limnochordia bacterium]